MKSKNVSSFFVVGFVILSAATAFHIGKVQAEQSGSTPESGVTSSIRSLYTTLQGLSYGSDIDTPDWGTFWNRIKTAATWQPSGNADPAHVLASYTFYSNSRTQQTGTYNASSLLPATVKSGVAFGAGQTGAYPSSTYPLAGDTGSDATAADIRSGTSAWDKTGSVLNGTYPAPGPCSTQVKADVDSGATQATNCTANIYWTVPSDGIAGTDHKDPVTGLIWSQMLFLSGSTVTFSSNSYSNFNWNGTTTFTVTAANASAGATYTNNGATFTVTSTIAGATSLVTTGTAAPATSGTLTKTSGIGDATITFSAVAQGYNNAVVGAKTAFQLCSERGNGWRLPSQKEIMQAYIDGAYFNLSQGTVILMTSTQSNTSGEYSFNLFNGGTNTSNQNTSTNLEIRCVR